MKTNEIVNEVLESLATEFMANPYLCYTEQGFHALFFTMLLNRLPLENRYSQLGDKKVSIIQKEYPTFHKLKDTKRGHWDIAVLEAPLVPLKAPSYDYLKVNSAVEFGLNESLRHLEGDIQRLTEKESNVAHKFVAHFYRLSDKESLRDWNPRSRRIVSSEEVARIVSGTDIVAFYASVDRTHNHRQALRIADGRVQELHLTG